MSQNKSNISSNNVTPGKKLIQARLPFKTLATTPKDATDTLVIAESRKRKLSTPEDESRTVKIVKISTTTTKENITKTEDVIVPEIIDLVEDSKDSPNDSSMINDEKVQTVVTPKSSKKKSNSRTQHVLSKRGSHKNDFEESTKVLIKISSSKKKKPNERHSKKNTVLKIEENEDDDIIPIDSEENSLTSLDEKDRNNDANKKLDDDLLIIDDELSEKIEDDVVSSGKSDTIKVTDEEIGNQEIVSEKVIDQNVLSENISDDVNKIVLNEKSPKKEVLKIFVNENTTDEKVDENVKSDVISNDAGNDVPSNNDKKYPTLVETEIGTDSDDCRTPTSITRRSARNSSSISPLNKTPTNKIVDSTILTPKQLQRKLDFEMKRLAKEKAKEDRERKLQEAKEERERKIQEEKEQRQKERDEKERQRKKERDDKEEQKRKEREDKEEQRRKEKEERDKKKQAEIDAKNEEKRQKEEEKRLKEEEKIAREEAEMKKKRKEVEAFTKFFAKKKSKSAEAEKLDVDDAEVKLNFMPFRIKDDMRLAPIVRRELSPTSKSKLEDVVLNRKNNCSLKDLYVHCIRNGNGVPMKQGKTWPIEDASDDLMIVDDIEGATAIEETTAIQKYRAKYYKFEENRRPPYYGTWQKKSTLIKARRPFTTDSKFFDYEIDSDDEWDDEGPGESLNGSEDEKDKESDDDYDIDNEFFVPHGHLSDEEIANNDEIDDDNSPDTQKAKLKILQKVFTDEMKKKTEKIKPRLIGFIWQNKDGSQPDGCPNVIWDMLTVRSMISHGPNIVIPKMSITIQKSELADEIHDPKKSSAMKKRIKLTEDRVSDLIRLIHGNTNSRDFLKKEFHAFVADKNKDNDNFQEFSMVSIGLKIKELAEWKRCSEEGPMLNKYCWYVEPETRRQYGLDLLSIVNNWKYILTPKAKVRGEVTKLKDNDKDKTLADAVDETLPNVKPPKSNFGNIAKFTKVLTNDDKMKNISLPQQDPPKLVSTVAKSESSPKPTKKRVKLLMSGPRGQELPTQAKNSLISQYLSNTKSNKQSIDTDEVINID